VKWKQIISLLGMQAGKQLPKIAKCFAKIAIEQNQENRQ